MNLRPYEFSSKYLKTKEGKRDFYHYWSDVPESYVEKKPPQLNSHSIVYINRELRRVAGVDVHGHQRIMTSWAGTLPEIKYYEDANGVTHEFTGKKYAECRKWMTDGYEYFDDNNNRKFVKNIKEVPEDKVCQPVKHIYELGQLFWVVEWKYTAEELVTQGYLPPPDSDRAKTFCIKNGQRYRKPFDNQGEYVFAFFINEPYYPSKQSQAIMFYRDITMEDVEKVKAVWQKAHKETSPEFTARLKKNINKFEKIKKNNELLDMKIAIEAEADRIERIRNVVKIKEKVEKRSIIETV